jgi:hypothetical protein
MGPLSSATPVELGFVFTILGIAFGGFRHIDRRFNRLEMQMREQQRGRLTRQQHEIWALRLELANSAIKLVVPRMANGGDDSDEHVEVT